MIDISKSEVSNSVADQINVGPPPVQLAGPRSYKGVVFAIVIIILLGAGAAFAWLTYGDRLSDLALFGASSSGPTASIGSGDSVATADFAAFQQQTTASLQSATQLLTDQQTELKRLSDQLAGLTTRIDGLQSAIAAATPATAAPAPAAAAPVAAAPRPIAPRKRPATPPPAGAISLGGAPLPATGPSGR
jgi:uncharacterized coiled-coil protein SlyX